MGVFSTNQNRQMYVATASKASVAATDAAGTIAVKSNTAKTEMYFNYVGADKTVMRSDIIPLDKVTYAKTTDADALKLKLKSVKVTLNGSLKAGEDYILRINIAQAFGKADDTVYQKFGAVRATSGMTVTQFWTAMKDSLVRNFSKELTNWFTFTADSDSLTITEVEQDWIPGKTPKENVYFTVVNCFVKDSAGIEVEAYVINKPTYTLENKNGHIVVDQEIFYMGERGDQYRDVCGIYKINTQYLAKPDVDYCAIDIHYSFADSNEGVQKSEKDIYIVGEKAVINAIVTDINAVKAGLLTTIGSTSSSTGGGSSSSGSGSGSSSSGDDSGSMESGD